jgi:hypothetical protein
MRESYMKGYREGYASLGGSDATVIIVNPKRVN